MGKNRPNEPVNVTREATVQTLNDEGFGVFKPGGSIEVWIPGAFPGERIKWRPARNRGGVTFGDLVEILAPSPARTRSLCTNRDTCMGCPLGALDYPAQLEFKQERVRRALKSVVGGAEVLSIRPAEPPWGYRATAKLAVSTGREGVRVGLFKWGSHRVTDTATCGTHHPLINALASAAREELSRQMRQTGELPLRYMVARVSPQFGKAMVTLVLWKGDSRFSKTFGKGLTRRVPELVSIHENLNPDEGSQVFGPTTKLVWGHPDLLDQVGDIRIYLSPVSFFQAHHGQAAGIYDIVRHWAAVGPSDTVVDLYCGVGGIAMNLSRDAGEAIGIESSESAVRDARRNATLNGIRNCKFRATPAEKFLEVVPQRKSPHVLTLNPPRSGASEEVLTAIETSGPARIIYVSCNPETLGRDIRFLARRGFRPSRIQPVDMFPQTAHVETVVLLEAANR